MEDYPRDVRDTFSIIPQSDEITRNVFHTNLAAMLITSFRTWRIIDANDVFFDTFGLNRAMTIGLTAADVNLLSSFDQEEAVRLIRAGESVRGVERKIKRPDGTWVYVSWTAELVEIENKECLYSVFLDITKLKIAENQLYESKKKLEMANMELERAMESKNRWAMKAEEASDAKSAFLANTSHEIRTPMNAIVGYTEMLLDDDISTEQRHALKMIEYSAENLLALIDNILDLSKIEANKLTLESVPFDIEEMLFQTMHLIQIKAANDKVEILGDTSELTSDVKGDPMRMRQVLTNLLGNAAKFTSEGQILVRAREIGDDGEKINIEFTVEDSGVGISDDMIERVFDPFVQGDGSITRQYGGTGLGLAICRSLVSLMDGTIRVKSELDKGSTFTFDVWLEKHRPSNQPSGQLLQIAALQGKRVLLVDDNPVALSILRTMLKVSGMHLTEMTTLSGALSEVESNLYDIVLVDAEIPNSGKMIIPDLLRQRSRNTSVVLIGLSQRCTPTKQDKVGYNSFITKPLDQKRLFSVMYKMLGIAIQRKTPFPKNSVSAAPFSRLKILVAEDHEVNQQLMITMIEKLGHTVQIAADGQEAFDMGRTGIYDLILMDMQMPKLSGLEATLMLREAGVNVPIIALTASAMKVDMERCLRDGMNDYVTKPIKREILQKVIHKHLGIGATDEIRSKVRTLMISQDEHSAAVVRNTLQQMLPSASIRLAPTYVEGLVSIGSLLPHIIVADLSIKGFDILQLVEYLQSEEIYSNIHVIALMAPSDDTMALANKLYEIPTVEIISKPIDKMDFTDTISQIVSGSIPCSSYIPAPHSAQSASGNSEKDTGRNSAVPQSSALSVASIAKEMMLEMEEYTFLLDMYISSNRNLLERIEKHFSAGAYEACQKEVHALRGSSANLFLKEMATHCGQLETLLQQRNINGAVEKFQKVKEIFNIVAAIRSEK